MVASYRFGPFTVDAGSYRLLRGSDIVPLSPKIIDLLLYLAARQSTLVSKDELFAALWPDVAVTDNALTQAVSELRQALGDDPGKPTYIQTVARRGYRFIAQVESASIQAEAAAAFAVHVVSDSQAPAIAVLDFANVSTDREFAWLSSGIAETVSNDLRAAGALRVIDRVRVVEAVRRIGADLPGLRKELHLDRAVVGSFQRAGDRLRITARVVDAGTGEALAEAKADGALEHVFELQDRIVAQCSETLGTSRARSGGGLRHPHHETSSLEAYKAFTEGRVRLESLDASLVPAAIADFEASTKHGPPRGAPSHWSPGIGDTTSGLRTPNGERTVSGRWGARSSFTPIFHLRISEPRWCISPEVRSIARSQSSAKARSCRIGSRTCGSAIPRKAFTGSSASCVSRSGIMQRRAPSSTGRFQTARASFTRRSSR